MITELVFDGVNFKMQMLSNTVYKDFLKQKGISISEIENDKHIALGFTANVFCDTYTYINPSTKVLWHVYEYIESVTGEDEFGSYVLATTSDKKIDVFKLYDCIMKN